MDTSGDTFTMRLYSDGFLLCNPNHGVRESLTRPVLKDTSIAASAFEPRHSLQNPWDAPFFYEDSRHVFYVTTSERIVQIPQWDRYGIMPDPVQPRFTIPPLVFRSPSEVMPDTIRSDRYRTQRGRGRS